MLLIFNLGVYGAGKDLFGKVTSGIEHGGMFN